MSTRLLLVLALIPLACNAKIKKDMADVKNAGDEYGQAKSEFDDYHAESEAKADAGWEKGMAVYDAYMADPPPPAPTQLDAAVEWMTSRLKKVDEADSHFADVQMASQSKRGYYTHLRLGEMQERLVNEAFGFSESLSPEDTKEFHGLGYILTAIDDAERHFNAWEAAYAESGDDIKDELADEITKAEAKRDEMRGRRDESLKISE